MAKTQKKITSQRGRLEEWSPSLLKSRLYGQILVDIIIGDLAPGQRLDEKALTVRYGGGAPGTVNGGGVAGVREALARLALEGLVVRRARVGTMVAPLDTDDARDAFLARALIEIECAGLSARNASKDEAAAIRATLDRGEAAVKKNDRRALAAMDEAFHVAVASASHNRTLAKLVMALHHTTARFWLVTGGQPSLDESQAALAQHRALADAIAAGDVEGAQVAMRVALGEFPDMSPPDAPIPEMKG
jgi:DNA-binding GntR family transcriptional regulator